MTNTALKLPSLSSTSLQKPKTESLSRSLKSDQPQPKHPRHVTPRSRERGVLLTLPGWNKLQAAKSQAEFQENAGDRFTLEELSERTELSLNTISKVLGRLEAVDRSSLQMVFQSFGLELTKSDYTRPSSPLNVLETQPKNSQHDWGEAVDVSLLCGRETELATLQQWILEERCRLVAVLGMGGIGKSALAVKLALQIEQTFEKVVWRSLQNAPSLDELLDSILPFLLQLPEDDVQLPSSLDRKIAKLMDCLRTSRCLLILDNIEPILASGDQSGRCRVGYESYAQLFQYIGAIQHQSCVILTSREKHRQITLLEGEKLPVRSLQLGALNPIAGRELFQQKGQFIGSDSEWKTLIEYYGGNPLALKLVAATTQELFNGRIADVLKDVEQDLCTLNDIRDVLDRQFDRLSPVEQEVMIWLAIHHRPVALNDLRADLVSAVSKRELPGALRSLLRRSLIEPTPPTAIEYSTTLFSLQPIVMKYVLERLICQICHEIEHQQVNLLKTHRLFDTDECDRIKRKQKNLILQPIVERLLSETNKYQSVQQQLQRLLDQQQQPSLPSGYTRCNLLCLLTHL